MKCPVCNSCFKYAYIKDVNMDFVWCGLCYKLYHYNPETKKLEDKTEEYATRLTQQQQKLD
jgi:hypothetical protein